MAGERKKEVLTVWFLVYQSPMAIVISPSGVEKGTGITDLGLTMKEPNPPEALWKWRDGK